MVGQISDEQCQCVIRHSIHRLVSIDSHPADRFAARGHSPDHHVALSVVHLLPDAGDLVSVADGNGPVAPDGIELAPGDRLDSEGGFSYVTSFGMWLL